MAAVSGVSLADDAPMPIFLASPFSILSAEAEAEAEAEAAEIDDVLSALPLPSSPGGLPDCDVPNEPRRLRWVGDFGVDSLSSRSSSSDLTSTMVVLWLAVEK